MTDDTDASRDRGPDEAVGPSGELDWLPERVVLPSDEWVIYPPGTPRPANFALRFEKAVPSPLVGTASDDAPGVHVLPHPGGCAVFARFGEPIAESRREFGPPETAADRDDLASWVQTWVDRVDRRAERERVRTACAPVPNAGRRVADALFEHFGDAAAVAAAVVDGDAARLRSVPGIAERTADDILVHYGTDAEWEYYRRRHRGPDEPDGH